MWSYSETFWLLTVEHPVVPSPSSARRNRGYRYVASPQPYMERSYRATPADTPVYLMDEMSCKNKEQPQTEHAPTAGTLTKVLWFVPKVAM